MRIEVDVYKGPLANTVGIQKGQLSIVLGSARAALEDMDGQLITSMCRMSCYDFPDTVASDTYEATMNDIARNKEIKNKKIKGKNSYPYLEGQDVNDGLPKHYAADDLAHISGMEDKDKRFGYAYPQRHTRMLTPGADVCKLTKTPPRSPDSRNYIAPENKYQTCQVYVRMRQQLRNVKWSTDAYMAKDAGKFMTPVAFYREVLLEDQKAKVDFSTNPCKKIISQPERDACSTANNESKKAYEILKAELVSSKHGSEALRATTRNFTDALKAVLEVTDEASRQLQPTADEYEKSFAIRDWMNDLKTFKAQIEDIEITDLAGPVTSKHTSVVNSSNFNDALSLKALTKDIDKFEESRAFIASHFASQNAIIQAMETNFNEIEKDISSSYLTSILGDHIISKDFIRHADELEKRLRELGYAVNSFKNASPNLNHQYEAIEKHAVLKPKISFSLPAKTATPENIESALETLTSVLNDYKNLLNETLAKKSWSFTHPRIIAITNKISDVSNAAKADKSKLKKTDTDTIPPELETLNSAVTALKALPFPDAEPDAVKKALADLNKNMAQGSITFTNANERPASQQSYTDLAHNFTAKLSGTDGAVDELGDRIDLIEPHAAQTGATPLGETIFSAKETFDNAISQYRSIYSRFTTILDTYDRDQAKHETEAYSDIAAIAASMRILATAITFQMASVEPEQRRLLIDMAKTANLGAEISNQLTSRANALNLQIGDGVNGPVDRNRLSTGQYLRDTQPTAYVDMYDWLQASTWWGRTTTKNRINVAKRLFESDNWSRVNEVYASGAGDVSMAFIRDEIGNWNLKSFANDPSDLTSAHTKLTLGLLEKAADIADLTITGGAVEAAKRAADIAALTQAANASQTGTTSTTNDLKAGTLLAGIDMSAFRKEMLDDIEAAETEHKAAMEAYPADPAMIENLAGNADLEIFKKDDGNPVCPIEEPQQDSQGQAGAAAGGQAPPNTDVATRSEGDSEAPQVKAKECRVAYIKTKRAEANDNALTKVNTAITRYKDLITAMQTVAAQQK